MRITAALLSLLALLGLGGCKKPAEAGGVTDKTDPKAPKAIESRDISDFYATFCLSGEWSPGRVSVFYTFAVKPDEAGVLTASEETTGVRAPADRALLDALQKIIDERKLVGKNGEYRVTAGLPPEFRPSTLTVRYASGEQLSFTRNNDPRAEWSKDMYLVFASWFASRELDALLPPETVTGTVTNVALKYRDAGTGRSYRYGIWSEPNEAGQYVLFRYAGGEKAEVPLADMRAFCGGVNEIMARYDLRPYDVHSALYGYEKTAEDEKDPFSTDFALTFWFEDGDQLFIHTSAQSAVDDLMPLARALTEYFDAQFPEG